MTRPLAVLLCATCMLASRAASAKPKVALTQIEGDASGDVHDAVVEALEGKELALIGSKEVNRAVDKLGDLADLTEKDFKKLATELEADAIVLGKLEKVGGSKTLKFRLYVHKKMAKGFTVSFKDAKSEKFRTLLHDKILDKIGVAASGDGDDDKPAKKKKAGDDDEDPLATKTDPRDKKKPAKPVKGAKAGKAAKADDDDAADTKPAKKAKASDDDADTKPAKGAKGAKTAKADDDADTKPAKKAKVSDDDADTKPAKKAKASDDDADTKPGKKAKVSDDEDAKPGKKAKGDKSTDDDAKPASEDDDAPRKGKKKVATSDDGNELEGGITGTADPDLRRGDQMPRAANRAAARADVGLSVIKRSFKFNTNIAGKPKNVSLSPVPGARFEGELYPLALSTPNSAAAGLGIAVEFDKTLSLNLTSTNATTMATATVPVKQLNYAVGVRYRLGFGRTETSPSLTLGVGYGKRIFSPNRAGVTDPNAAADIARDTPNIQYTVIDPGLTFRLPVVSRVAVSIGGRGLLITSAGSIQNATSYGRAKVYGFEGTAAVDIVLTSRFLLRLSGDFVQVGYQFMGVGTLSNNLDGNPATKDVGGLADQAIGGAATLAVVY